MNKRDELVIIIGVKSCIFIMCIGLVFGSLVPTMISANNSVIVLFGVLAFVAGGVGAFRFFLDIKQDLLKLSGGEV